MSTRLLELHLHEHHRASVERLNVALEESRFANWPLEHVVRYATVAHASTTLRDCAAEALNHGIFWRSLSPHGGGKPFGRIANKIMAEFNSYENFARAVMDAAVSHAGEGWLWITLDTGRLKIVTTSATDTPVRAGQTPLLAFDLCEHAFFYDYCGRRHEYMAVCLNHLVNWDSANATLDNCYAAAAAVMATRSLRSDRLRRHASSSHARP